MATYGNPLSLTEHAFLCCVCTASIKTSSKHMGASKHMGVSRHIGGIQTHGGVQTCRGAFKHMGASKCMGHIYTPLVWQSVLSLCCVCTGGIQTYGGQNLFFLQSWTISAILNFCHFFLILNILSIFQTFPLSFALCVDRNSLLWGVHV